MALGVKIVQCVGQGRARGGLAPVLELPPLAATNVTADGTHTLDADAISFELVNYGDVNVWFRVREADDATEASAADPQSIPLLAGAAYPFMLPDDADPLDYEIDIRAFV